MPVARMQDRSIFDTCFLLSSAVKNCISMEAGVRYFQCNAHYYRKSRVSMGCRQLAHDEAKNSATAHICFKTWLHVVLMVQTCQSGRQELWVAQGNM